MRVQDGTMTAYVYPVTTGTPSYQNVTDEAHHIMNLTRSWNSSDVVNTFHVLSYLVVFRPSDQAPPAVRIFRSRPTKPASPRARRWTEPSCPFPP